MLPEQWRFQISVSTLNVVKLWTLILIIPALSHMSNSLIASVLESASQFSVFRYGIPIVRILFSVRMNGRFSRTVFRVRYWRIGVSVWPEYNILWMLFIKSFYWRLPLLSRRSVTSLSVMNSSFNISLISSRLKNKHWNCLSYMSIGTVTTSLEFMPCNIT